MLENAQNETIVWKKKKRLSILLYNRYRARCWGIFWWKILERLHPLQQRITKKIPVQQKCHNSGLESVSQFEI